MISFQPSGMCVGLAHSTARRLEVGHKNRFGYATFVFVFPLRSPAAARSAKTLRQESGSIQHFPNTGTETTIWIQSSTRVGCRSEERRVGNEWKPAWSSS